MALVTLTTDFGLEDYYVAAVKGVLLTLAPGVTLVDVSHLLEQGAIADAAHLVAAAAPRFPAGSVHLAVVDPGVGSDRRILAAAAAGRLFVAPDNGLLTPLLPEATEVRAVDRPDLYLPGPGNTFHGRDRFAPVAAYLARGEPLAALGPLLDDPVLLPRTTPRRQGEVVHGSVVHIDRFGNLVTDIPADWLGDAPVAVSLGSHRVRRRIDHYGELKPGEAGLLTGSLGTLELSANGESLAHLWRIERGAEVIVRPQGGSR